MHGSVFRQSKQSISTSKNDGSVSIQESDGAVIGRKLAARVGLATRIKMNSVTEVLSTPSAAQDLLISFLVGPDQPEDWMNGPDSQSGRCKLRRPGRPASAPRRHGPTRLCVISDGCKAEPRPESTRNLRSRRLRWRRATLAGSLALAGWPCQCRSLSSTLNRLGYKWRAGSHWHGDSGHPSRCNDRVPIVGRCLPPVICIIIVSRRLPSESASPGSSRHDHAGWAAAARL